MEKKKWNDNDEGCVDDGEEVYDRFVGINWNRDSDQRNIIN